MNIKSENKIDKPIIGNNEMLTDISPVHPQEGSIYKTYDDENITAFDSLLDTPENFDIQRNKIPVSNKFTHIIAETKLHNINSYANKEKEKELFKKSQLEPKMNFNNNDQPNSNSNSNNNSNNINKGEDFCCNFNSGSNDVVMASSKNLDNMATQKYYIPLSKLELKNYSKKAQSNTQQQMNSYKKAQAKISLTNNGNLNNSSSVIEINYNQKQTDEEEKEKKNYRSKNNSQYSSRNNNENFQTTQNSFATEAYKNSKISSNLNIVLYSEVTPPRPIQKRSSNSKESSLIGREESINTNKNTPEGSSNSSKQ